MIYRSRRRLRAHGIDGLHPKRTSPPWDSYPRLGPVDEQAGLTTDLAWPTSGHRWLSLEFPDRGSAPPQAQGERALWRRELEQWERRLQVLKLHAATTADLHTERTRRNLRRPARNGGRIQELVCLNTFLIGKHQGVEPMWQITACDTGSSYAWAKVVLARSAKQGARFLTAGWSSSSPRPVGRLNEGSQIGRRVPSGDSRGKPSTNSGRWRSDLAVLGSGCLRISQGGLTCQQYYCTGRPSLG